MLAIRLLPLLRCLLDMNPNSLTLGQKDTLNTYSLIATGGDAITATHALAGAWVTGHILSRTDATMAELVVHTAASTSDLADGRVKRWVYKGAAAVLAKADNTLPPTTTDDISEQQWQDMERFGIVDHPGFDHWVDKGYFYAVVAALVKRHVERGNTTTATLLAINLAATVPRDILRTQQKNELKQLGGDNHASKLGKYKTLIQNIGLGVLLSPAEKYRAGRALGVGILSVSTVMGINDYRHNIKNVRYARLHKTLNTSN